MKIKPPKPGLGFGFWDLGFWDLVWLGLGVAIRRVFSESSKIKTTLVKRNNWPFNIIGLQEQRGANIVWMRDLKSVANIPMPRPGKTGSGKINTQN